MLLLLLRLSGVWCTTLRLYIVLCYEIYKLWLDKTNSIYFDMML